MSMYLSKTFNESKDNDHITTSSICLSKKSPFVSKKR